MNLCSCLSSCSNSSDCYSPSTACLLSDWAASAQHAYLLLHTNWHPSARCLAGEGSMQALR